MTDFAVDVVEYNNYFTAARYQSDFPQYYPSNLPEKSLEHYIAAKLLQLTEHDVYIDIASEHSPVPDIYHRLFGVRAYRQDLAYPDGLHGDEIGGNAANMPVLDEFASKMALHCSFEHFEGDADMRFIRECNRVLQPGGAVCFVPLYLSEEYAIQTDPTTAVREAVQFEEDAILQCAPGWGNRHGRFYDPVHVFMRIVPNLGQLHINLYRLANVQKAHPSCYARFAMLLSKPR
jgi:SAM-dependent methyltransferase